MDDIDRFLNSIRIVEEGIRKEHDPETYYRFYDSYYADGIPLLEKFYSIKKTPKGVWIVPDWDFNLSFDKSRFYYTKENKKFILDKAKRKYAYNNLEDALISYIKRKERQILLLETQLFRINEIISNLKKENVKGYDIGKIIEKTKERYQIVGVEYE